MFSVKHYYRLILGVTNVDVAGAVRGLIRIGYEHALRMVELNLLACIVVIGIYDTGHLVVLIEDYDSVITCVSDVNVADFICNDVLSVVKLQTAELILKSHIRGGYGGVGGVGSGRKHLLSADGVGVGVVSHVSRGVDHAEQKDESEGEYKNLT